MMIVENERRNRISEMNWLRRAFRPRDAMRSISRDAKELKRRARKTKDVT